MKPNELLKNIATKILAVMADVENVERKGWNKAQSYKYVTEIDTVRAIRAAMVTHGLAIVPSVRAAKTDSYLKKSIYQGQEKETMTYFVTVRITYTLIDKDSGETMEMDVIGHGMDTGGDKGIYKAMTGANKYALLKLFQIPSGDDPEATDPETGKPTDDRHPDDTPIIRRHKPLPTPKPATSPKEANPPPSDCPPPAEPKPNLPSPDQLTKINTMFSLIDWTNYQSERRKLEDWLALGDRGTHFNKEMANTVILKLYGFKKLKDNTLV